MTQPTNHTAAIPNPALEPLRVLVGEWDVVGRHRLLPDTPLYGHTSFAWLEGGAFLIKHSVMAHEKMPDDIAIFGSDDATGELFMLHFDDRTVSRKYAVMLQDHVWKLWRNAPGFSQRFTGAISEDGDTIVGVWELSEDDLTWQRDVESTYTRVK
jgi:hypothetical protein